MENWRAPSGIYFLITRKVLCLHIWTEDEDLYAVCLQLLPLLHLCLKLLYPGSGLADVPR